MSDLQETNSSLTKVNSDLQLQISKLLALKMSKGDVAKVDDVLPVLKSRIASHLSDDGVSLFHWYFSLHFWIIWKNDNLNTFQSNLIFPNGVKASAKLMRKLETISGREESDRNYVNELILIIFTEKYIKKQVANGLTWYNVLQKFRESNRYETMKGSFVT